MTDIDRTIAEIATRIGLPCLLTDTDFNVIGYTPQQGVDSARAETILQRQASPEVRDWSLRFGIAETTDPIWVDHPSPDRQDVKPRLCVPITANGRGMGYLWFIDPDGEISAKEIASIQVQREVLGELLYQRFRRRTDVSESFRTLQDSSSQGRGFAAAHIAHVGNFLADESIVISTFASRTLHSAVHWPFSLPGAVWVPSDHGDLQLITRPHHIPDTASTEELVRAVAPAALNSNNWSSLDCGVGAAVADLTAIALSSDTSRVALRVARARATPRVERWSELGALRLLFTLESHAVDRFLDPALAYVNEFATNGPLELLETAFTYLESGGSPSKAASVLNIHRQTLWQRLRTIHERYGIDLNDGRTRLELQLALTMKPFRSPAERTPT